MKKILGLMLYLAFVSMVFASHADRPDIAKETKDPNPPQYVEGVMRSTGGPDDFGYEWIDSNEPGGPVYSWIEINATGTNMNLTDDSHFWPIPFNFDFYGVTYNNVAVGSNGTVYFQDVYLGFGNAAIPGTNAYGVHEFIAVYWDDLNPSAGGACYYEIMGNLLIVEWDNVSHYGGGGSVTAQAILDGATGAIVLQYLDPSSEAGGGACVGIQGSPTQPPLWGLQYSYLQAVLTPNLAIWFGVGGMAPSVWDFEDGLQGWTHTNGQAFPAGWDVESSGYYAPQAPPDPGDSTMWVDSDAGGSAFWIQDSALSPAVVPNASWEKLKYGACNYHFGPGTYENELRVGIKHFTSGVWTAVELAYYSTAVAFGPAWDSVDVSAYAGADSLQVYFYFDDLNTWGYWASFDNVGFYAPISHDVGCAAVLSPPAGPVAPADYDVIGEIWNYGGSDETFDVVANVYDTVGMVNIFTQTINLTLTAGADTNLDFGQVTFPPDMYFMAEIYTMLAGDVDPSNDTSVAYSRTAIGFPDIVFELDAQAACNDNQLLGIEFDGEYFYVTGGGNAADPNKVYVMDTAGTLMWTLDQPAHSTGWGWRDLAWDDVYAGPDRIDTLYASVNPNVDYFSIDLTGGNLVYHGFSPGAQSPNRALAFYPDSGWFYTANFSSDCYKFNKAGVILQNVANTYAMYGAAYDHYGDYIWWHSQDDPGTGFLCQLSQMDPYTMAFTGLVSGYAMPAALTDAIAGGLCYYSGFRGNLNVLFALLQGTPNDYIVGILVSITGIEEKPGGETPLAFGFAPSTATVTRGRMPIAYTTKAPGHVSLKVYDGMGRLVQTLVNTHQSAGEKSIHWDNKDLSNRTVANGVYFLKLEAENQTAVHKLILLK